VVYAVNNLPLRLEARAEADGTLLWSWALPSGSDTQFVSEVLLTKNLAFVSTDRATYAVDLATHEPVFSYPASGKLALSANAILYIHNSTDLIALNLK
jgi:outer membrane protein assembly factor BamB